MGACEARTMQVKTERTILLAIGQLVPFSTQTIQQSSELGDIDRIGRIGRKFLRSTPVYIVEMTQAENGVIRRHWIC